MDGRSSLLPGTGLCGMGAPRASHLEAPCLAPLGQGASGLEEPSGTGSFCSGGPLLSRPSASRQHDHPAWY